MAISLHYLPDTYMFISVGTFRPNSTFNLQRGDTTMADTGINIMAHDTIYCLFLAGIAVVIYMVGSGLAFHG